MHGGVNALAQDWSFWYALPSTILIPSVIQKNRGEGHGYPGGLQLAAKNMVQPFIEHEQPATHPIGIQTRTTNAWANPAPEHRDTKAFSLAPEMLQNKRLSKW